MKRYIRTLFYYWLPLHYLIMSKSYVGMKIDFSFSQLKKDEADMAVTEVGRNTNRKATAEANENFIAIGPE